jgi:hypothetical protein
MSGSPNWKQSSAKNSKVTWQALGGVGYLGTIALPFDPPLHQLTQWCDYLNAKEHDQEDFVPRLGAWGVRGISHDQLRWRTLRRQFPAIPERGPEAVLELFRRLGPIQSQVPRAPFMTISSRLPGVTYDTVRGLFESHQLVKTSNIRGTVHSSVPEQFGWLDAVARHTREVQLRNVLKLQPVSPEELVAEVEAFTSMDWRARSEIVAHARAWLAERGTGNTTDGPDALSDNLIWGHSGLLRRPPDTR